VFCRELQSSAEKVGAFNSWGFRAQLL